MFSACEFDRGLLGELVVGERAHTDDRDGATVGVVRKPGYSSSNSSPTWAIGKRGVYRV